MLETLRKRREDEDQGFTLIELMVVILIIAILIAIAIPTFLGAQKRAKDRAAQSDLRNALQAARTLATDFEGQFCDESPCAVSNATSELDATSLETEEAALAFSGPGVGSDTSVIAVDVDSLTNAAGDPIYAGQLRMWKRSKSGKYFGIFASSDGDVKYCKGDDETDVDAVATCNDDAW